MLINNNNKKLTRYEHVNDEYVFFVQRWNEILETKTLDMYQYNILNSCVACDEYVDVIEKTLAGIFTSRQNVDDCKAESVQIIKADPLLEKYNCPLRNTLLRVLNGKIESKSKVDSLDDKTGSFFISLNRIKHQLKNPLNQLKTNYLEYVLSELKVAIDAQDNKLINVCIGILASQCIYQGWSAKGLMELSQIFKTECSSDEKWRQFYDKIKSSTLDNYEIYYSIKIETRVELSADKVREIIASMGLEVIYGADIIEQHKDNTEFCSKINSETTYVMTNISMSDPYSAVLRAINILNSKLSVATFYNTINPWIANYPQIVYLNCQTGEHDCLRLTDIFKTYDYVDSNNGVFENNESAYHCYKAVGFKDVVLEKTETYNVLGEEWKCIELEMQL